MFDTEYAPLAAFELFEKDYNDLTKDDWIQVSEWFEQLEEIDD
ncbi:hypothetical protein GCM10007968_28740 [Sporolactobacillus putidus]|uniref:Uncharacterized protein n=1 Tax=Sporolactobacillus putidus TaxID=492735 RepID=A0A917S9I1_9BACL|nr:hypothetical protein GCM10007968_28740 [Sporolactobacillus putidus]